MSDSPAPRGRARSRRRAWLHLAFATVFALGLVELGLRLLTTTDPASGLARIGRTALVPFAPRADAVAGWFGSQADTRYFVLDEELGWTVGPNGSGELYNSDGRGVRRASGRDYADLPSEGVLRIVTVGDSFTHGDEVPDAATWQAALERLDPRLEVLNLGVGGYGTDQAFLRWRRDGRPRGAQIAILGIWPENVCRNLNVCRYFLTLQEGFMTKPRFVIEGAELVLVNSPVATPAEVADALDALRPVGLLKHERWLIPWELEESPWNAVRTTRFARSMWSRWLRQRLRNELYTGADPSGNDVTVAIAHEFAREAARSGSMPFVLFLPMRELIGDYPTAFSFPLAQCMRDAGLAVVDATEILAAAVEEAGIDHVFLPSGHYTAAANELVARHLATSLETVIAELHGR